MEIEIAFPLNERVTSKVVYDGLLLIHEKFKGTDLTIDVSQEIYYISKNGVKVFNYTLPEIELVFRTEDENGLKILEDAVNMLQEYIQIFK